MATRSVTQSRRVTDQGEPTNREVMDRLADMRKTLEDFITEQRAKNASIDVWRTSVDVAAALRQSKLDTLASEAAPELQNLHDFKVKVETLTSLIRFAVGGSLIAAVVGVIGLVVSIIALSQKTLP